MPVEGSQFSALASQPDHKRRIVLTYRRIGSIICLLVAAVLPAGAQEVKSPTLNVRDVDEEARNAYQEPCSITSNQVIKSCQFPPLPPGKRLAIRWLSASCSVNASRVAGIQLIHELSDATNQAGAVTRFQGSLLQAFGITGERVFGEPLYAHADSAPRLDVLLRDDPSNGTAVCSFSLRGYLINK
jgi:hypothetical protein